MPITAKDSGRPEVGRNWDLGRKKSRGETRVTYRNKIYRKQGALGEKGRGTKKGNGKGVWPIKGPERRGKKKNSGKPRPKGPGGNKKGAKHTPTRAKWATRVWPPKKNGAKYTGGGRTNLGGLPPRKKNRGKNRAPKIKGEKNRP